MGHMPNTAASACGRPLAPKGCAKAASAQQVSWLECSGAALDQKVPDAAVPIAAVSLSQLREV